MLSRFTQNIYCASHLLLVNCLQLLGGEDSVAAGNLLKADGMQQHLHMVLWCWAVCYPEHE